MKHIRTVRNFKMSLFQSLMDDIILRSPLSGSSRPTLENPLACAATVVSELVHAGKEVPVETPDEVRRLEGGQVAWTCVKLASELFLAKLEKREGRVGELEDALKDSSCDPGWVKVIIDYLEYFGPTGEKDKIPYINYRNLDDFVLETLPRDATVAVVGDWGTGTDNARSLLGQLARHKPDALIHLGDIYYSGTTRETHSNFLDICNQVFERTSGHPPVYTLSGNHDMYSGGVGYYKLLPELNPSPQFQPKKAQPASFFCLRSPAGAFQLLAELMSRSV